MSSLEKITISLPAEMVAELKEAVAEGEFANTSEAVRDALRRWRRARAVVAMADEDFRRLIAEAKESGEPVDGEGALNRLRTKYAAMSGRR